MTNNNLLGKATRSGFTGIELICDFQNLNAYGCSDSEDSDSSNQLPLQNDSSGTQLIKFIRVESERAKNSLFSKVFGKSNKDENEKSKARLKNICN